MRILLLLIICLTPVSLMAQGNPVNPIPNDSQFISVDANYPGGWGAFVGDSLQYPAEAINNKWEGTVRMYVQHNVDGTITIDAIISSGYMVLDSEAIRLMRAMPWRANRSNGIPISYPRMYVIYFDLDAYLKKLEGRKQKDGENE